MIGITESGEIEVETFVNIHSHLREDKEVMSALVENAIKGGADTILPMPNTKAGLKTVQEVIDYIFALKMLVPEDESVHFIPCMLLNKETQIDELRKAADHGINDVKVYPFERTTNARYGVRNYGEILHLVRECGKLNIRVHFHPEHPWLEVDNRDAEYLFLPFGDMFLNETEAEIFWEHGTDARCIAPWIDMMKSERFYVTLTAHHPATNEDLAFGDVRAVCKPPIKTARDQHDIVLFVKMDYPWVMAGPDDAPHPIGAKHVHRGRPACGSYTSPFLLPLYAHVLGLCEKGGISREAFLNFTSRNARKIFEGLPSARRIKMVRKPFVIPSVYQIGPWEVEPFWAGQTIDWSLVK